jgi:mono/diheme cytochrome c family protein
LSRQGEARTELRGATAWLVAALAVSALLTQAPAAPAQPPLSAGQDPAAGSRVFDAKGCARCHTVGGGGKGAPDLARTERPRSFNDLASALWNHAPQMAARMRQLGIERPRLDPRESGDLVAFLYTLHYFDPPGRPDVGRKLFTEKRCAACHRIGGAGGDVGPRLDSAKLVGSPIDLAAAMWNHGPQMADAMAARGVERPTFTETELIDLIAYVTSASPGPPGGRLHVLPGRAEEGVRVFVERRCVECHSLGGRGRQGVPDLAERGAQKSLTGFAAAMWNKAPVMRQAMAGRLAQVPKLSPEEMSDLVAALYAVRYFARAGDPRQGVTVAAQKGCLTCHGLHGERGKPAGDLAQARGIDTPAGVLAGLWNHSFIADPRAERDRTPWPVIRPDEMGDLVAYLHSLKRAR